MKTISNNFREALRGVRQLSAFVTYQSDDGTYLLTTEDEFELTTELNDNLGTEKGTMIIEKNNINSINPVFETKLFKTVCKSVQLDIKQKIEKKTKINVQIGVLVGNDYEYLDFGEYVVNDVEYKADTKSYLITAYDKMLEAMVDYDLQVTYPITIKNLIIAICEHFAWEYDLGVFVNQDKILESNVFDGQELTYRDVLDQISQVTVSSMMFDNKIFKLKYISKDENTTLLPFTIPQTINVRSYSDKLKVTEDDLKDKDITMSEKYGPVNSLLITNNKDVVINNLVDSQSIEANGKYEFQIDDNLILLKDSDNYIGEMFQYMKDIEYYLYDIETFGILFLEPLDNYYIQIEDTIYPTLMLNSDIKLTTGLKETIYADIPEISTTEYNATDKNEKKINNALIKIDKANGQIVLKADSNGKIVEAELNASADSGTEFNVNADNIKLEGYTTINDGFSVDLQGNMTCNNATINDAIVNGIIVGSTIKGTIDESLSVYIGSSSEDETYQSNNSLKLVRQDNETLVEIVGKTWRTSGSLNLRTCYFTGNAQRYLFNGNLSSAGNINSQGYISSSGNITCNGDLTVYGSKNRVVSTDEGDILLNAYETATPYFGDIGSNTTDENGECIIYIDELFKQTIENDDYKVFVQECGDGRLYVEKYNDYFIVKGTSNLNFDWELKAIQKGYKNIRLEKFKNKNI